MDKYTKVNAKAVDSWVEGGWEWGTPVTPEVCEKARNGEWDVLLTPILPVPKDWFLPFKDIKILGLASGGGQQMPIFSILGGNCTVMDLSTRQLENERIVAQREGYEINIVQADMTEEFPFENESFDLIFHPVSNVFIEDVQHVWNECHRVLKPGGVLLSGLSNGITYLFDESTKPYTVVNTLPWNPLRNPEQMKKLQDEDNDCFEFSHTFDDQIGGQLRAGFVIVSAYEDYDNKNSDFRLEGIPTYWATKAIKTPIFFYV